MFISVTFCGFYTTGAILNSLFSSLFQFNEISSSLSYSVHTELSLRPPAGPPTPAMAT